MAAGALQVFTVVLARDLRVAWRRWSDAANPALFFLLVVTLFPLALSPRPEFLRSIAPGVLWVAALLATLHRFHGPAWDERLSRQWEEALERASQQMLAAYAPAPQQE